MLDRAPSRRLRTRLATCFCGLKVDGSRLATGGGCVPSIHAERVAVARGGGQSVVLRLDRGRALDKWHNGHVLRRRAHGHGRALVPSSCPSSPARRCHASPGPLVLALLGAMGHMASRRGSCSSDRDLTIPSAIRDGTVSFATPPPGHLLFEVAGVCPQAPKLAHAVPRGELVRGRGPPRAHGVRLGPLPRPLELVEHGREDLP
mmetsp:Transcript_8206/g.22597  ORF Transcript_8206/g.22597 Transcript_8206/m.22597 type:complete len:204 (+) Transcript_8206:394-1005(+)